MKRTSFDWAFRFEGRRFWWADGPYAWVDLPGNSSISHLSGPHGGWVTIWMEDGSSFRFGPVSSTYPFDPVGRFDFGQRLEMVS